MQLMPADSQAAWSKVAQSMPERDEKRKGPTGNVNAVMNGELDLFIQAFLRNK
jgi:hypothetical protein